MHTACSSRRLAMPWHGTELRVTKGNMMFKNKVIIISSVLVVMNCFAAPAVEQKSQVEGFKGKNNE